MVIVRSSETPVRTSQTICFLTQVATTKKKLNSVALVRERTIPTQYEMKVFEVMGVVLFYRPQILYKL